VIRIAISQARRPSRAIMATLSGLALLITAVPVSAKQASTASSAAVPARSAYVGEVAAEMRSRLFYPKAARARGAKGVVGVAFTIGASGAVSAFAITRSSGDSDLDAAARSLVQSARFLPPPGGWAHITTSFFYVPPR
jgi:TonB family protein